MVSDPGFRVTFDADPGVPKWTDEVVQIVSCWTFSRRYEVLILQDWILSGMLLTCRYALSPKESTVSRFGRLPEVAASTTDIGWPVGVQKVTKKGFSGMSSAEQFGRYGIPTF